MHFHANEVRIHYCDIIYNVYIHFDLQTSKLLMLYNSGKWAYTLVILPVDTYIVPLRVALIL